MSQKKKDANKGDYYVDSKYVEYVNMHLWKQREFFRNESCNNRSKYRSNFNQIHEWALLLVQQAYGFGCAEIACETLRMFEPFHASIVYNAMYKVLNVSSIAGMNDEDVDPALVQEKFGLIREEVRANAGKKREEKAL